MERQKNSFRRRPSASRIFVVPPRPDVVLRPQHLGVEANARPKILKAARNGTRNEVVAVVNQKGGVGKTTTAINLGAALTELGHQVLLIDLDPQANSTSGLGIDPARTGAGVYALLTGEA